MGKLEGQKERIERLLKRNEGIKAMHTRLSNERVGKAKKYTQEAIMHLIADKFYLSEKTVEDVIYDRVNYKSNNQ